MIKIIRIAVMLACIVFAGLHVTAQTEHDAVMMAKNNFCVGGIYSYSSWNNYWEGTLKRSNENIGTVSTKMYMLMGNYGVSDKLNILFGVPYIQTKGTAGTLAGDKGIQDLSVWLKWLPIEKKIGPKTVAALYGVGGVSTPLSGYEGDFLPFALGLHSTNLTARVIGDIQTGDFFVTGSGSYVARSNITINRDQYYTTSMHYTNKVEMPNVVSAQARAGYRTQRWIIEGIFDYSNTIHGFDIRRNDMPFPSNNMDWTSAGFNIKYTFKKVPGLSLVGGSNYVLSGRNVGESKQFYGGVFYIFKTSKHAVVSSHSCKLCSK